MGAGPDAQKSLEKSVNGITQQKVNWDSANAVKEISDLEKRLDKVRREQARLRKELTSYRETDTYQHSDVFGVYNGTLEKIADRVNKEQAQYEWLLDRPPADKKSQVTVDELRNMYNIFSQLTKGLQQEIKMRHLQVDKLIAPDRFKKLVESERRALARHERGDKKRNYPGYEALKSLSPDKRAHMLNMLKSLVSRLDQLSKHVHGWAERAAREIASDQDRVWRQLLEITEEHIQALMDRGREVSNPSLKRKLDSLSTSQYLSALKKFAIQLETCVSDTVNTKGFAKPNDKIAEIASICYVSMYGVK